jgi:predicted transcriptional regulator
VPVEHVGEVIAGRVDRVTAGQVEPFEVVAEDPADRAVDDVVTFVGRFDDLVAEVIDGVAVVTGTADQRVGAEAAVERVVAREADESVVAGVAAQAVGEFVAGQRGGAW